MNYLGIQSAPSLLPYKEQLSFRSFCVVKSTWCWAGSPCTRSPVVLKALSAWLCLWKFGSICLLAVSLRTRLFFCADDFNHSILYSFSQLKHEAGANTVFSLQSVQPWLSVVFFLFKFLIRANQSRVGTLGFSYSRSFCFPPIVPSSPPALTALMPLSVPWHHQNKSHLVLYPRLNWKSQIQTPQVISHLLDSFPSTCHMSLVHWIFNFQPFPSLLMYFIFLNHHCL